MTREEHRTRKWIYQFGPSVERKRERERERELALKTAYVYTYTRTQAANDPRRPFDYHK